MLKKIQCGMKFWLIYANDMKWDFIDYFYAKVIDNQVYLINQMKTSIWGLKEYSLFTLVDFALI